MAGRPNGQRTATRRNARGVRPSWRATTARSSIAADARWRPACGSPLGNALDDEEALAGLDVAETACLGKERGVARLRGEPPLEARLLELERLQLRLRLREFLAGVEVARQRLVVQEGDEADDRDGEPAAVAAGSPGEALGGCAHGSGFAAVRANSSPRVSAAGLKPVQHDLDVAAPLTGRGRADRGANQLGHVGRRDVGADRARLLGARRDPRA